MAKIVLFFWQKVTNYIRHEGCQKKKRHEVTNERNGQILAEKIQQLKLFVFIFLLQKITNNGRYEMTNEYNGQILIEKIQWLKLFRLYYFVAENYK